MSSQGASSRIPRVAAPGTNAMVTRKLGSPRLSRTASYTGGLASQREIQKPARSSSATSLLVSPRISRKAAAQTNGSIQKRPASPQTSRMVRSSPNLSMNRKASKLPQHGAATPQRSPTPQRCPTPIPSPQDQDENLCVKPPLGPQGVNKNLRTPQLVKRATSPGVGKGGVKDISKVKGRQSPQPKSSDQNGNPDSELAHNRTRSMEKDEEKTDKEKDIGESVDVPNEQSNGVLSGLDVIRGSSPVPGTLSPGSEKPRYPGPHVTNTNCFSPPISRKDLSAGPRKVVPQYQYSRPVSGLETWHSSRSPSPQPGNANAKLQNGTGGGRLTTAQAFLRSPSPLTVNQDTNRDLQIRNGSPDEWATCTSPTLQSQTFNLDPSALLDNLVGDTDKVTGSGWTRAPSPVPEIQNKEHHQLDNQDSTSETLCGSSIADLGVAALDDQQKQNLDLQDTGIPVWILNNNPAL